MIGVVVWDASKSYHEELLKRSHALTQKTTKKEFLLELKKNGTQSLSSSQIRLFVAANYLSLENAKKIFARNIANVSSYENLPDIYL